MKGTTFGLNWFRCMLGGIVWCCRASEAFNKPARPAVPSVCPMTVLIEPTYRISSDFVTLFNSRSSEPKKAESIASASIGSPAGVPVPCA